LEIGQATISQEIRGLARPRSSAELPAFVLNDEASERVVRRTSDEIAFELHRQAIEQFFGEGSSQVV
jgi:hypothetical protein